MHEHRQTDRQTDSPNQHNILGATISESDLILDEEEQLCNSYEFKPQLDGLSFDKAFLDELEIGSNGPVHILASARNALFGIPGLDYFPLITLSSQGNGIWEFYSAGVHNTSLGLSNAPISFSWKEDEPLEGSLKQYLDKNSTAKNEKGRIRYVQLIKKTIVANGQTIEYLYPEADADLENPKYKDLISNIEKIRLGSASFRALNELIEESGEEVCIGLLPSDDPFWENYGASAVAQQPMGVYQDLPGVIAYKTPASPLMFNAEEISTITEELFHQYQNILYERLFEFGIHNINPVLTVNMEAEAKVFNKLVIDELGLEFSPYLPDYLLTIYTNNSYTHGLEGFPQHLYKISQENNQLIEGHLLEDYFTYLKVFEANQYRNKNYEEIPPDAFNNVIRQKNK
ncbi:hypothetical protein PPO43_05340 [Saprospira sp. CCB-QB6]|uniref:hypothetical protein n=1 Tax=Saprospira sp. CCB-QB6 TaxID=3023936 RepID=UPI00234AB3E1|nr:hypothetical protein [Saprospira sp. CCB-QB6]WCL82522.1 hypothetical protein PPO43_05340 [Saprospira sp. CCB-QB6]